MGKSCINIRLYIQWLIGMNAGCCTIAIETRKYNKRTKKRSNYVERFKNEKWGNFS